MQNRIPKRIAAVRADGDRPDAVRATVTVLIFVALLMGFPPRSARASSVTDHLHAFARIEDRATGTPGCERAAKYVLKSFQKAGLSSITTQKFFLPVARVKSASVTVDGRSWPLYPWGPNMATLSRTPPAGVSGELVYAGDGALKNYNGHRIEGAIVLMDLDSSQNWLNAAMLGAKALIFLGSSHDTRYQFLGKNTPTPLTFPRFWVPPETAQALKAAAGKSATAVVKSETEWIHTLAENIFGLVEGKDPKLTDQLIVLQASYDATSSILGLAPGADEASSISMLLTLAEKLAASPPDRSVLFVATAGAGQGLAGMREFIWSATGRRKDLSKEKRYLRDHRKDLGHLRDLLTAPDPLATEKPEDQQQVLDFVVERAKDAADYWTREIQYQKALELNAERTENASPTPSNTSTQTVPPENPRAYRRLSWHTHLSGLNPGEQDLARALIRKGLPALSAELDELKQRQLVNRDAMKVKRLVGRYTPALYLSLSLSSTSLKCGIVEWGDTFPLQDRVTRQLRAFRLADEIKAMGIEAATELQMANPIQDSARATRSGQNVGTAPADLALASDVAAIATCPAVSLVSLDNERLYWGTPNDRLDQVNLTHLETLARFLSLVIARVASDPATTNACQGAVEGIAGLNGQAMFVRQGELFADQPAPGTIISAIQGNSVFRAMVFRDGTFFLAGLANRRVAFEKIILEPYGISPTTGRVAWTADKVQTGKDNYRVKLKSRMGSTALIMFHCEQTDVIGAFDPQKLDYLTKVQLLDGVTGARPVRYWYSRVDGRDTMAISILLEKGTRFKLILSDTLLRPELLLINGTAKQPLGTGYPIGPPNIILTPLRVAGDMYHLLGRRIRNLTQKGIVNRYLDELYASSGKKLDTAQKALADNRYDQFWHNVVTAWAELDQIYGEVESTQRDVLTGVMFFVALFVPFAYCMERYLFCFRGIYQQVVAFFVILLATIFTIRALHPAFQLTYNPMVVIIAFFIVGLSLLVSWIIFTRFEQEMAQSRKTKEMVSAEAQQVNKWQAFGAGFAIGASNLNRRKMRTALTCVTLIILTFTVMSFTNVKTIQKTTLTRIGDSTPYRGILMHHQIWRPLPPVVLEDMKSRFEGEARVWPRGWVPPRNPLDRTVAVIEEQGRSIALEGLLGLGPDPPAHLRKLVQYGHWPEAGQARSVLLPSQLAKQLGLDPQKDLGVKVRITGEPFEVVGYFDGNQLEVLKDLDDNRDTPAYLEMPADAEISAVEVDAMQSGEVITPMSERFRHARADLTVIVPYRTCIAFGGQLEAISILPHPDVDPIQLADRLSEWLIYPLFVGESGTWYHSASQTLRYQGVANIIVPLLIVVFICLNTMIGHVQERQKEISVYTSVGLAPLHVGFLFIVEAMSLAVLSTVIGYILAQISAKFMGHSALFSQLTFNYSSLASVACMFLVFSVVFIASLYPAKVAARLAMPDVTRTWKLPDPEGDTLILNLPFLLKNEEEMGIMRFLTDFIASSQDVAHGSFTVSGTSLDYDSPFAGAHLMPTPVCMMIRADVWLAPFDFGIKQRIQIHCCPSEANPGYLEIAIRMIRLSGEHSSWVRSNTNFIKSLRKQMLLWRFLTPAAKARYMDPQSSGEASDSEAAHPLSV